MPCVPAPLQLPRQVWRYALTGIASNLLLYLIYLALTALGGEPKTVMSVLYLVGMLQTFLVSRSWTFGYQGPTAAAFQRYLISCAAGYLLNFLMLLVLVDFVGWNHRYVKAAAVPCTAALLFLMYRHWVFRAKRGADVVVA